MDAKLSRMIDRIQSVGPRESDIRTAMRYQLNRIRMRTAMGVDVNGFPFLRKKDGTPSYLNKSGNLLRSLKSGSHDTTGIVGVAGTAREYAAQVNAKRKFLGASVRDRIAVVEDLRQASSERKADA